MGKIVNVCIAVMLIFTAMTLIVNAAEKEVVGEEEAIRSVLNQLVVAVKEKDIDKMVEITKDLRWPDSERQRKNLEGFEDKLIKFDIIEIIKVERDLYKATVIQKTELMETEATVEMPIFRENGSWKVIIGHDYDSEGSIVNELKSSNYYTRLFSE